MVVKEVVELLQTDPSYTDTFEKMVDADCFTVYVYHGTLPYFIGIYDNKVHLGVEDEKGVPRCLVESNKQEVIN